MSELLAIAQSAIEFENLKPVLFQFLADHNLKIESRIVGEYRLMPFHTSPIPGESAFRPFADANEVCFHTGMSYAETFKAALGVIAARVLPANDDRKALSMDTLAEAFKHTSR